ncbi:MAG: VOC family protein [Candidatus Dormibacteria bacterium]|jgi:predicted enzyme related to lactoylglutathione lyase
MNEARDSITAAGAGGGHPQGTPDWADLQVHDVTAGLAFYCGLFGWDPGPEGPPEVGGYRMPRLAGATVCGVGPVMQAGAPPAWTLHFAVDDVDEAAARVAAHGGAVRFGPMDVLDAVRMGVFADPAGAHFGLSQERQMRGFGVTHVPGAFAWAELATTDLAGARGFYPAILPGVTERRWDGEFEYHLLVSAGRDVAGMFALPDASMSPAWTVSFQSADVEQTAARAREAGADLLMGPTTTPGVGTWAVLRDPQGATFGLLQPPG